MSSDERDKKPEEKGGEVVLTGHLAQVYGDWLRTHKGSPPPLYRDATTGQPIWLNRKERRAREKLARKKG